MIRLPALVLVPAILSLAGNPALQQAGACRTFSAEEIRTITGASGGTIWQACRFDLATMSRICSVRTQTTATNFEVTFTDKYNSVADFVDEVRIVPPIARIQTQARQYTSGRGTNGQIKYEYDGDRRQTRLTSNMGGNLLVTTYTSWDPKGRPTIATISSQASSFNLQYKYDDALRTMTITGPAGIEVDTYDENGNMIKEETADGMGRTFYAVKITKTDKVCK
ncbi:MAG TPA: hypothetical protein VN700_11830 [Vicinamibacterales bacterium]|nr:hypothetical protein [Vicinamibacterales bacterium]